MVMSEVLEVLRCARALISEPAHWCQESYAIDQNEGGVVPKSERAVAWCAVGAIDRCAQTRSAKAACIDLLTDAVADRHPLLDITELNDGVDADTYEEAHTQVLAVYDAAILAQAIEEGVAS